MDTPESSEQDLGTGSEEARNGAGNDIPSGSEEGPRLNKRGDLRGMTPETKKNLVPGGVRKPAVVEPVEPVQSTDGAQDDQHADMRHVYNRPDSMDRTEGQKRCREWLKDDVAGFMRAKAALEARQGRPDDKWDGHGTCPCCGRGAAIHEDEIEELKKEYARHDEWLEYREDFLKWRAEQ